MKTWKGIMNDKNHARIACYFVILVLVTVLGACRKTIMLEQPSSKGDFQIHLISLSQIADTRRVDEDLDILNKPQYTISDDQIKSYDWSQQVIVFDDSVQEMYIDNVNFLAWPSNFAIVWNGEIVAEGEILDIRSPVHTPKPVIHVLEPRENPQFPTSAYRNLSSAAPDAPSVGSLSIILSREGSKFVFDNVVAQEIKEHFYQDGRLID